MSRSYFYHIWIVVLLLCVFSACSTSQEKEKLAYNHFKIGVKALSQGRQAFALDQLLKARDFDPTNELILNHLGLVYYFMKEYEHAIVAFKNSLQNKATYSEAHNNLGRAYVDIKDFKQARKHLFKAANDLTYQHKDKVWLNIGLSYFFENRFEKSQKYFLKAISLNRSNCLAYNYYGRAHVELENFSDAAKTLDQAIYHCRKKGLDQPHYYSAISLFRLGYKSKAIARLQEGKKLFPNGSYKEKIEEMMNLMRITETN